MKDWSAINRLRSLRVEDVMNRNVFKVSAQQRMVDVAAEFIDWEISAAPVTDDNNRCIGMVSATDFLRCLEGSSDAARIPLHNAVHVAQQCERNERCAIRGDQEDSVSFYMTSTVRTVSPETSLLQAALVMASKHLHRLPVVDDENRVIGMISTTDVITSLVNSMDQANASILTGMNDDPEC